MNKISNTELPHMVKDDNGLNIIPRDLISDDNVSVSNVAKFSSSKKISFPASISGYTFP